MPFLRFLSLILDRLFVLTGALIGAQFPLFIQQYTQRLAGHVTELSLFLNNLRELAHQSNKTLEQYITKFQMSMDPDFSKQGQFMLNMVKRWENLNETLQSLLSSSIFQKPYYFLKSLQYDIAEATLKDFQPGLNLTTEGLSYMVLGGIAGFCAYCLLGYLFSILYRQWRVVWRQAR